MPKTHITKTQKNQTKPGEKSDIYITARKKGKICMSKNMNLYKAKAAKNDEFYTKLSDVSKELAHYKPHFKDKVVYCNCDDQDSAFWKYFHLNFERLGLKKLLATHYDQTASSYKLEYEGGDDQNIDAGSKTLLKGDGDFRSQECVDLLISSDIVCTNLPFSLFREYVARMMQYGKKFIIWGNNNAITYKEFFPLLKENKVWLGYMVNQTCVFALSDDYPKWDEKLTRQMNDGKKYGKVPAITVFTNLDHHKRHENLTLRDPYIPEKYPKYANYDAINVNKVSEIPFDYEPCWYACRQAASCLYARTEGKENNEFCKEACNGEIGVPITYMGRHNPEQYEIIGSDSDKAKPMSEIDPTGIYEKGGPRFYIKKVDQTDRHQYVRLYKRIVIRKKTDI